MTFAPCVEMSGTWHSQYARPTTLIQADRWQALRTSRSKRFGFILGNINWGAIGPICFQLRKSYRLGENDQDPVHRIRACLSRKLAPNRTSGFGIFVISLA
jgi:hypothetical protein